MPDKAIFISITFILVVLTFFSGLILINTFFGDPTIYLVYAKNIAQGDFFSFNPGEFSSGSTSPLWALILSISFLFDNVNSAFLSKIISCSSTIIALIISFISLLLITKHRIGGIAGTFTIAYFLIIPGIMLYESSLIIILISCLILLFFKIINDKDKSPFSKFIFLTLIFSLIPLTRPDASTIILICFGGLIFHFQKTNQKKYLLFSLISFFISLIPSVLYYGYSYIQLGTFSVSSYCRSFALQENASEFLSIKYSLSSIKYFLISPKIIYVLMAIWGIKKITYFYKDKSLVYFAIISIISYFIILTFISPVTVDSDRYILPVIPFFGLAISIFIKDTFEHTTNKNTIIIFLLIFVIGYPLYTIIPSVFHNRSRGLNFDTIVEKNIIHTINSFAEPNSKILVYEVQDRFYLRPDITLISLDGITDGKVAPYLKSGDMYSFLLKYKPDYWLANDAVNYRPYLKNSVLNKVFNKFVGKRNNSISFGNITIEKIKENEKSNPIGFASYRALFKLNYKNH